ncbi:ATP-dependent RecD-like DNA helicase [termite gut metagenome]|uniref:ATP-dependent RecD-like DNA helicase n=1 Tax=termite gut metagenome TaxID=433724 RepID=A0A5J4RG40_9ZZZZ
MQINPELQLAWDVVEKTGTHLFLTGKAGTGKTTFLQKLKETSPKRMVVTAPTGIAAINAGGVTVHSFFQLPFAPYVPDSTLNTQQHGYKFGKEKIHIIRSMDLLVIDEVSMVRADLLDAVDAALRRYRNQSKPFGGVQLLMIGDMQQLTPVRKDHEWELLSQYYTTGFFFDSLALKKTEYVTIELKKVYRQSDTHFLHLLNKIRNNEADDAVLNELNKRHIPNFRPDDEKEGYIRLTTHNYQAQQHNDLRLNALAGHAYGFRAETEGNFPENSYPADVLLTLKKGAQIMFIKNDSSVEKRFYNGKIGFVTEVDENSIWVRANDDEHSFQLAIEKWTNSKYSLNPQTKEITEEVEGTFLQYPIRLAWAITIHKSQGLTFERAIIDANNSFAHGQVYVALSRCKTLEGMVLASRLDRSAIICDTAIKEFDHEIEQRSPDEQQLRELQRCYFLDLLSDQFNFHLPEQRLLQVVRIMDEHLYRLYPQLLIRYKEASDTFKTKIGKVANTFHAQYSEMVMSTEDYANDPALNSRITAGAHYFRQELEALCSPLLNETRIETDNKEVKKKFTEAFALFKEMTYVKNGTLALTEKEGFSVSAYLKNKTHLMLSAEENQMERKERNNHSPRQEKAKIPSDILHPVLYSELIEWRNAEAKVQGANVPVYTVVQQKAIVGIVNLLPRNVSELLHIPYIGKQTVEKYGEKLLDIVNQYVEKAEITRQEFHVTAPKEKNTLSKSPTKETTYKMFRQGMSIEEIAKTRGFVTGTIVGHLETYLRQGDVSIQELVPQEKIDTITHYLQEHEGQDETLSAIKTALGEEISYTDIRAVMASIQEK